MGLLLLFAVGGFEFNGQAAAGIAAHHVRPDWFSRLAAEYRPQVRLALGRLAAEVSVRASAEINCRLDDSTAGGLSLKPYRLFLNYGQEQFEVRAGLQQLNFGSATLLRPLRWFDRLDPRDPAQTTEGVYGLLARLFPGNSSVWIWGLVGNSAPKGAEPAPTPQWLPEGGGRIELAFPKGEAAASCHFRRTVLLPDDTASEQRLGLDTRWDLGIGLWTEAMLSRTDASARDCWQQQAMLGADYTFGVGSGLTLLVEHLLAHSAAGLFQTSAISLGYPLGIMDNLQAFVLFDWSTRQPYSYLGWKRSWDSWIVLVAGFWNPEPGPAAGASGKGVSLTVIFNH